MKNQKEYSVRRNTMPASSSSKFSVHHGLTDSSENLPGHIRFKFDLQPENMDEFASIMEMVINKLTGLKNDELISMCELYLQELPSDMETKIAWLIITRQGNRYIAESKSSRWDNAFLNAFDIFCRNSPG